ncbi:MAG: TylF/MycF family methyltransferase [Pirellulales bacterium]
MTEMLNASCLAAPASLYLDLLKKCLTRYIFLNEQPGQATEDPALRIDGRDWPPTAETMIGLKRLDNIELCIREVLERGVPGDLIETGVWRGGAVIFMRGLLQALGDTERLVWVADSFQGLPRPDEKNYPADKGDPHWSYKDLAVSQEQVKRNFEKYGLLDDRVRFLVGFFKDTLVRAPIDRLAVLRLDGDMYQSTMEALTALYPKLSPGGYVIVDDYGAIPNCRQAVDDFRRQYSITEPLRSVDWTGTFWKRNS